MLGPNFYLVSARVFNVCHCLSQVSWPRQLAPRDLPGSTPHLAEGALGIDMLW